jgi:tetratricopeptide (TPR) repeat protein
VKKHSPSEKSHHHHLQDFTKAIAKELWYGIESIGFFFLLAFLFSNILLSQFISPIYFQMVNEDKSAVVSFLKKSQTLPEYEAVFTEQKAIFGDSLRTDVYSDKMKREKLISQLEDVADQNPKNRDVLYDLYLLYKQNGDTEKAQQYLDRAKAIDPLVEKSL